MIVIKKEKMNSLIMGLYIFQFGLMQPIAIITKTQLPVAVFTLLLIFITLLNNGLRVKRSVVAIFIVISIYFLISSLIIKKSTLTILPLYTEFIFKSFSAVLIGSIDIEEEYLFKVFIKMAVVNFIVLLPLPLLGLSKSIGYMRYGYAMAPSVLMFSYKIYSSRKINLIWLILTTISLSLMLIYGSRGPLVALILFAILMFLFSKGINMYKKGTFIVTSGLIVFFINKYNMLLRLLEYIYFNLNIQTYALAKFMMMINSGIATSSSGRDSIYLVLWEYIKQNPMFGHGIGFTQVALGHTAHNIFLQILLESGIMGLIIWSIIWVYCYVKIKEVVNHKKDYLFKIIIAIVALALGRLLVSSDMWLRPEYWFVLSMLINYKEDDNKTNIILR